MEHLSSLRLYRCPKVVAGFGRAVTLGGGGRPVACRTCRGVGLPALLRQSFEVLVGGLLGRDQSHVSRG